MIIDTNTGKLYLAIGHAESRLLERSVKIEWVIDTLINPDQIMTNPRGRDEYIKRLASGTIIVVIEDDDRQEFDGIIVTVIKE